MTHNHLKQYIREVPDFPKPGVNFYDITTLIQHPIGFKESVDLLTQYARTRDASVVAGIESRGFIFGAAIAHKLDLGLVTIRKPGKLPSATIAEEYELEYGTDKLEVHTDAITEGARVLLVDDLIATGGTLTASAKLIERLGGEVAGVAAVIGLPFLPFEHKLADYDVHYLFSYDSE